jgi:hypothetical protein
MKNLVYLALIGAISSKHLLAQEAQGLSADVDVNADLDEDIMEDTDI